MEEGEKVQTFKDKLLFKITAFFVLLGTFSLFAFLFLVPFVIDPAFTTIFMQFEPVPAMCVTAENIFLRGTKNCTWSSCREGCTREMYNCTQIRVHYKIPPRLDVEDVTTVEDVEATSPLPSGASWESSTLNEWSARLANKIKGVHHFDEEEHGAPIEWSPDWIDRTSPHKLSKRELEKQVPTETAIYNNDLLAGVYNESEWSFTGAKLYPNVKGCGYPPALNCSIFFKNYITVGTNFSCYYSKVDPFLVISELDMRQVYINLILATTIPIPSFIISVIYLAFAYFVIYAEDPPPVGTDIPNVEADVQDEQDDEEKELSTDIPIAQTDNKTSSLEDGLPDIDADDEIEADELPDKQLSPSSNEIPNPGELIKPAAMMVVRPSSLQPSGPIAAV